MKLFDYVRLDPGRTIAQHEQSGRFIPLTQIQDNQALKSAIADLIPLLHAPVEVADPIQYVFSELVRNVLEHSVSPVGAFVCAQYYRNQQRLSIGIADAGIGIRASMKRSHKVASHEAAIRLALQPGITGATPRIGGNEFNAGAGLFYTKSIAALSRNYFILYSGDCLFKLLRGSMTSPPSLHSDPTDDEHTITTGLPDWQGTVVGIDMTVSPGAAFSDLMTTISRAYSLDIKSKRKAYYKKVRFIS